MKTTSCKIIAKPKASAAFTSIELLVVIVTLGMLAMVLLPALAKTGSSTKASQCLNNLRQLQRGWIIYSTDNNDRIIPTVGQGPLQVSLLPNPYTEPGNGENQWVYGVVATPIPDFIKLGLIFPYAPNIALFKCPADPGTIFFGKTIPPGVPDRPTLRSISMNGYLAPIVDSINPSTAPLNPNYRLFRKQSDLATMGAANTWVMLDESPFSINDGWFATDPTTGTWIDKPAVYHNNACGISFADGHTEMHKWSDENLINYQGSLGVSLLAQPGVDDLTWLGQRSSIPK